MMEPDPWRVYGQVTEDEWRCKTNKTDANGECLGCGAVTGEKCRRDQIRAVVLDKMKRM